MVMPFIQIGKDIVFISKPDSRVAGFVILATVSPLTPGTVETTFKSTLNHISINLSKDGLTDRQQAKLYHVVNSDIKVCELTARSRAQTPTFSNLHFLDIAYIITSPIFVT